jgi:hypothetical protein
MRTAQEFFCHRCDGYWIVRLNMAINQVVKMVCPNCKHGHPREIKDGVIVADGHGRDKDVEEIVAPKSAYSKKPKSISMQEASKKEPGSSYKRQPRTGMVIKSEDDLVKEEKPDPSRLEHWFSWFGGRRQ